MPFIKVIEENNAEGKLLDVYEVIKGARGKVSNILKIHSLIPETMHTHLDLYKSILFSHNLFSREFMEMIAVVVSKANKCEYCINHHAEALNHYWKDEVKLQLFIDDYKIIEIDDKKMDLLNYAVTLTQSPGLITQASINNLKELGWNDEEILIANLIVSYFNFVNRIALGLGVEFTEEEVKGYKY